MNYYEIIKAIRNYVLYAYSVGGMNTEDRVMTTFEAAGFERIVNAYVDALSELSSVRNENKRACVYFDGLGWNQDQIAYQLNMSQPAVSQNLKWLKNFFGKVLIK